MKTKDKQSWLKKLSKFDYKTPYLLMDLGIVSSQYDILRDNLPDAKVYYAVKCNPEQPILETLRKKGSSFEVASVGELHRLVKAGVNPSDVIYSNTVKPVDHIKESYEMGLRYFAYDSPEELKKIAEYAPGSKVYLRMSVSNQGSLISLSNKFGANKSQVVSLLRMARELGLYPCGLSFHVGSQADDLGVWDKAFDDVIDVMEDLQKKADIKLDVLNIGGGFPIEYRDKVPSIEQIGAAVSRNLKRLPYQLSIWCEPGRFLVGEAGVIAGTIIGRTNRQGKPWLYLDVGRFQAFVEMFESDDLKYPMFTSKKSITKSKYTITGPSCDSYDTIMRDVRLPSRLDVGDKVFFGSAGAYTHVYGAPFNDFPVPEVVCRDFSKDIK